MDRTIPRRAVLALAALLPVAARAATIAEQHFDDRIVLADTDLVLNGLGVRQVAWLKGYAAALYLREPARTAAAALAVAGPKRIRMKMLVDVEARELAKAVTKGLRRNHPAAAHQAMQARIVPLERTILSLGAVKKGDTIDIDWLPAAGMVLTRNGRPQGTPLPGEDLYLGMMRVFIGDVPVDDALKAGLLGTP